jgi:outer membrane protein TolC
MQERLKLAQQEVEVCSALFRNARVDFDAVATAQKNLLKAQLELSTKKAERLAVYERYIKMLEEVAKISQVRVQAGRGSQLELVRARYLLVDAKIDLERAKTRK